MKKKHQLLRTLVQVNIYNKHNKCDVTLFAKMLQCSGNVFFFSAEMTMF